jgi:hypothetical protein
LLIPSSYPKYLHRSSLFVVHSLFILAEKFHSIVANSSGEYISENFGMKSSEYHHKIYQTVSGKSACFSEIFLINQGVKATIKPRRIQATSKDNFLYSFSRFLFLKKLNKNIPQAKIRNMTDISILVHVLTSKTTFIMLHRFQNVKILRNKKK